MQARYPSLQYEESDLPALESLQLEETPTKVTDKKKQQNDPKEPDTVAYRLVDCPLRLFGIIQNDRTAKQKKSTLEKDFMDYQGPVFEEMCRSAIEQRHIIPNGVRQYCRFLIVLRGCFIGTTMSRPPK